MQGWVRIGFWKVWCYVNFRFIYNWHHVVLEDARHRDKTGCLCLTRRNYMSCLKPTHSSNTDHHHTRRAGGWNHACSWGDFKAVWRCQMDLLSKMPRCGQGIDSSGCFQPNQAYSSLQFPPAPRYSWESLGQEETLSCWQDRVFLPFAVWAAEELILWCISWVVCPSTSAQGLLRREMWCLHGVTPRPPLTPSRTGH